MSLWSNAEITEAAKTLWVAGRSAAEVAKALEPMGVKVSRSAVMSKMLREGLARMDNGQDYQSARANGRKGAEGLRQRGRYERSFTATPNTIEAAMRLAKADLPPITGAVAASVPRHYLTRARWECAWIVDGEGHDARACCARIARGSYCQEHAEKAYLPPEEFDQ